MRDIWFKSPMIYKASPISDYADPIIIKITINFPKFVSACKKPAYFINSFLRSMRFLNFYQHTKNQFIHIIPSWDKANFRVLRPNGHTHFWPRPLQYFLINFQFPWICINMQKVRPFYHFLLEIQSIYKSCNLIGREHFGPYLRN